MLARAMEGQTMKRIILAAAFIALLGSTGVSWSADFDKGWNAYESGDYAAALREWKPLAEQGDASSQFGLGWMYVKGLGVPQDDKTAVKWYQLAAKQGDAMAQNNLGVMYREGRGVPQDNKTAVKWYRLAVEQGSVIC
jgi:TPR repeat protein